jgi:hypothetical protein
VIVVLALVPDRGDGHRSSVFNLEECDVAGSAKRKDDFANPRIVAEQCLPARERGIGE